MTDLPEGRKPLTAMDSADLVLRMHDKLAAGFAKGDRIAELEELVEACKADAREAEAYAAELEAKLAKAENGLFTLSHIHDGNPSDARADILPLDYARHMLWEARSIARATLAELKGETDE